MEQMTWQKAAWIGLPKEEIEKKKILFNDMTGRFAYFRCELNVPETEGAPHLEILVTANSRYRLWINGTPVLSGPCKGDLQRQYYEQVDVSSHLAAGRNVFALQVLYNYPGESFAHAGERAAIFGVVSPAGGHFLRMEGELTGEEGSVLGTVTTGAADWRVYLEDSCYLTSDPVTINFGAEIETIDFRQALSGWKERDFVADDWSQAAVMEDPEITALIARCGILPKFRLTPRPIPLLYEKEAFFQRELICPQESGNKKDKAVEKACGLRAEEASGGESGCAGGLREEASGEESACAGKILENGSVRIPVGTKRTILLDAAEIMNAYPQYRITGGEGAELSFTYFEKFICEGREIARDDADHGEITGLTDRITLEGNALCYEPFWFRTFRFLRIVIDAGAAQTDVVLEAPRLRRTGYPLEVSSVVRSSEPWVSGVWEMCVRTLGNCMTETYMDCPYYEQLQYPMDTRLQALFTYAVTDDTRLAAKALEDFHCSMTRDGLIQGRYPSAFQQIISTFSLHYIFMQQEYYEQTGDETALRRYLPDVDAILNYYDTRIGEDGLVGRLDYWNFVDWQGAWAQNMGEPEALRHGPSTIINLMYAMALESGARLCGYAGRSDTAAQYRSRREAVLEQVQELCYSEERGMYREGPVFEQYTQHAQAWAVLNELAQGEQAAAVLRHALAEPDVLPVSFSTAYEFFRAMEKSGLYAETRENMMRWAHLLELHCTTCPEEPENGRSECHAWSALPMYEMTRVLGGVRPAGIAWESVRIEPHTEYLKDLEGECATPAGIISFRYQREKEGWTYRITMPENLPGVFVSPDGSETVLQTGENVVQKL
ncbi:MAG: alpha-L-rhamnosidase C-terminal domain-containing protein [Eubacteriales bacterium]|nr:alpha-L-rhamnosidase C-terminal domain-containing protein [Eubacteriales bacterium]